MPDRKSGWEEAVAAFAAMQATVVAAVNAGSAANPSQARRAMDAGQSVWNYLSNKGKIVIPEYYRDADWEALGETYAVMWLHPRFCSGGVSVRVADPSTNYTCDCPRKVVCNGCKSTSAREAWFDDSGLVVEVANVCPTDACFLAWRQMKIEQTQAAAVAAAQSEQAARRAAAQLVSHSDRVLKVVALRADSTAADAAAAEDGEGVDPIEQLLAASDALRAKVQRPREAS